MQQGMEQSQGQQGQPQQGQGGDKLKELVVNVHTGLSMLGEVAKEVNPQLAEQFGALLQGYEQVVAALAGGQPQQSKPQQMSTMEQGAAKTQQAGPQVRG